MYTSPSVIIKRQDNKRTLYIVSFPTKVHFRLFFWPPKCDIGVKMPYSTHPSDGLGPPEWGLMNLVIFGLWRGRTMRASPLYTTYHRNTKRAQGEIKILDAYPFQNVKLSKKKFAVRFYLPNL